jgi:exopolysaccharide biosynthesis polyprenyl glycosylphosphotransferase
MTNPPAATHAAPRRARLRPIRTVDSSAILIRALDLRAWSRTRFIADLVTLYLASAAALFAGPLGEASVNWWLAAAFPLITMVVLCARRQPDERLAGSLLDTWIYVLGAVSLSAMLTTAAASTFGAGHPVALALRLWVFACVYVGVARAVMFSVRRKAIRSEKLATPTLVIGAGVVGEQLVRRLMEEPTYGMRPVGFLDADPLHGADESELSGVPLLGGPPELAAAVARTGAKRVILAFSSGPDRDLVETIKECEELGLNVSVIPRLYEAMSERATIEHVGGVPLLSLRSTDPRGWQFAVKHAMDRAVAAATLILLSPLMLVIALAVRLSSSGPIFFRQRRVGRDGRVFDLLKYRTMYELSDVAHWEPPAGVAPGGVEGLDRRTRVGRLLRDSSLDELPQLINVLRGEMSLVGPRPERPEFVQRYSAEIDRYHDRHRVKSGITGWAQVNGLRGQTSIWDRVEWDNFYIRNWSLWFDLRIIALTVAEVLRFRG